MPWDYYGQVVGSESRTMTLASDEELTLDALRAFVSVCEAMPGAAAVAVVAGGERLRLTAEVRTSQSVPVDGPRLCLACDGTGVSESAAWAPSSCPTCAGTGHPLPADDPSEYPTTRLPVVTQNGADRA